MRRPLAIRGHARSTRPDTRAQRVGRGWVRLHLELDALGDEVARVLPLDALAEARVEVRDDHRDGRSRTGIASAIGAHLIRGGPRHAQSRVGGVRALAQPRDVVHALPPHPRKTHPNPDTHTRRTHKHTQERFQHVPF